MTRADSGDFRERVIEARRAGASAREVCRILGVSLRTISRWEGRLRDSGSHVPRLKALRPRRDNLCQLNVQV